MARTDSPSYHGPNITTWEDLAIFDEEFSDETGEFKYTIFAAFDQDETAYFGKLALRKRDVTLEHLASVLSPIPDDDVFPRWAPDNTGLIQAQDTLPPNAFIKYPELALYDVFKQHNILYLLRNGLVEEARTMEMISKHPHPNIVRYHGCRVRRGHITGLVLDCYPNTLTEYLNNKVGSLSLDQELFMDALKSAVSHLHSLGLAHNDLHPGNVLVDDRGAPFLRDFEAAREIGAKLGIRRRTEGWIEGEMKDYHTSDKNHDLFALGKIRAWLDNPSFEG